MIRRTTTTDEYLDISRRGPPRLSLYFRIALKPKVLFVAADDLGCDFIATSMTQVGLGMYNLQVGFAHNILPFQFFTTSSFVELSFQGTHILHYMDDRAGARMNKCRN